MSGNNVCTSKAPPGVEKNKKVKEFSSLIEKNKPYKLILIIDDVIKSGLTF